VQDGAEEQMAFRMRARVHRAEAVELAEPKAASFIDSGSELSGTLRFRENVHIDGHVDGELLADKDVEIGPSASVQANLRCESVVIRGKVRGDIEAAGRITFHMGAHVHGEMKANAIVIEEGAQFRGTIVIGGDAREPAALPPPPDAEAEG
jgi:cytoskeletal protein CcmA (bactofilin family)